MRLTEILLGAVMRMAPERFRTRYGGEYLSTYRTRAREAVRQGRAAAVWLDVRELFGAIRLVTALRTERSPRAASADRRAGASAESVAQDVGYAVRTLRRNPSYALSAIAVLALGIGPTTAMFSAVNAYFFRPLPFADADRLVHLYETNPEFEWTHADAAPANVLDWREQVDAFEDVAMHSGFVNSATFMRGGEPVLLGVSAVTGNFFSVLGVRPLLGRTFRDEETWAGNSAVAVLSHGAWATHFGSDPDVIGRVVEIGGNSVEIVGVMPTGFTFPSDRTEIWSPWGWPLENREAVFFRRAHWVRPVARLAPGVSREEAAAQLATVVARLQQEYPETNRVMGAGMMPLRDFLIRDVRSPLLILLGAVGLLLLLSCANVANLSLVRAGEREREIALRHALGAGRLRIARQVITECVVLALAGSALGLAVGLAGVRAMERLTPLGIEAATGIALDARVLSFTIGAAVLCGVLFGLAPALRAAGRDVRVRLAGSGRGGSAGPASTRTAGALVVAEVALALLVVLGAGLMTRSFSLIRQVDPGFRTEGTLAVQFTVPSARYAERDHVLVFYDRLTQELEARPGIERVGLVGQLPLNGTSWTSQFQAEGWPADRAGLDIVHRRADNGYFEALGIPLLRGRLFEPRDRPDGPFTVLINATFAREHFPNEDPIGQRIAYDRNATAESTWYEIIGIVADQHQTSPAQPARAEVFENRSQDWGRSNWLVVRTSGDAMDALPVVRSVLGSIDPLIPIAETRRLRDVWHASMAREEFILTLLTIFGAVALLLAGAGVYAVTSQAARTRTREIGIRMALGAGASDVIALMVRRSLAVTGVGLVIGVVLSLLVTRSLASLLYGIGPSDPLTVAGVIGLLGTVAGLACYFPARRAAAADAGRSLRAD